MHVHNVVHVGDLGHIQVPRHIVESPSVDGCIVENEGHGGLDAGGEAGELCWAQEKWQCDSLPAVCQSFGIPWQVWRYKNVWSICSSGLLVVA
jgi:hypothetical protein